MPVDFRHKTTRIVDHWPEMLTARIWIVLLAVELVTCGAFGGESMLAPAVKAIEAGDFGGAAVTRVQLERYLPPSKPHPFGQRGHVVLRLNGEKKPASRPAQMQWISQPWNGENAQMPYLVYLPEKDRMLMLVQCGQPIHSALVTSADHGKTWSARHWLSVDTNGQPNGVGFGLTYLGGGKLVAFPEDLKTLCTSADYGQTWKSTAASEPGSEKYAWDPLLVVRGARRPGRASWRKAAGNRPGWRGDRPKLPTPKPISAAARTRAKAGARRPRFRSGSV